MRFQTYKQLALDKKQSDETVFKALKELLSDDSEHLSENKMDEFRNMTHKHRPEVMIMLHALVLEQHSQCCTDKEKLARDLGLDPSVSYIEIARALHVQN